MKPLDHKNLDLDVPYFADVVRYDSLSVTYLSQYSSFNDIFMFFCFLQHHRKPVSVYLEQYGKASPTRQPVWDQNIWNGQKYCGLQRWIEYELLVHAATLSTAESSDWFQESILGESGTCCVSLHYGINVSQWEFSSAVQHVRLILLHTEITHTHNLFPN